MQGGFWHFAYDKAAEQFDIFVQDTHAAKQVVRLDRHRMHPPANRGQIEQRRHMASLGDGCVARKADWVPPFTRSTMLGRRRHGSERPREIAEDKADCLREA